MFKGIRIQSQFLIFVEKSILYAKIVVYPKKIVLKLSYIFHMGILFS